MRNRSQKHVGLVPLALLALLALGCPPGAECGSSSAAPARAAGGRDAGEHRTRADFQAAAAPAGAAGGGGSSSSSSSRVANEPVTAGAASRRLMGGVRSPGRSLAQFGIQLLFAARPAHAPAPQPQPAPQPKKESAPAPQPQPQPQPQPEPAPAPAPQPAPQPQPQPEPAPVPAPAPQPAPEPQPQPQPAPTPEPQPQPQPAPEPQPQPQPQPAPEPQPPGASTESKPYCIPNPWSTPGGSFFNVLCAGDSITQGSVPSANLNHPFTIKLEQRLKEKLGDKVDAVDAGLGGGGIFMEGFDIRSTFAPYYRSYLDASPWDAVVVMIGINDLLRGGRRADEVMDGGLRALYDETLARGMPVFAIPTLAAPGFVSADDSKESERKKLATLIWGYADEHAAKSGGKGPQVYVLDFQAGPLDFYKMSESDRKVWMDDGLHLTEYAYDQIGSWVFDEISKRICDKDGSSRRLQ